MKLKNIIRNIRSSLTEDNHSKYSYFKEREGKIIACPHGLAQTFVNPKVSRALKSEDSREIILAVCNDHAIPASAVAAEGFQSAMFNKPSFQMYESRPAHVKQFYFNYGELSIHYLLGMFGITSRWNSHPETKLSEIHERLDLAFEFAEMNKL